jgi:hypothetical protein
MPVSRFLDMMRMVEVGIIVLDEAANILYDMAEFKTLRITVLNKW